MTRGVRRSALGAALGAMHAVAAAGCTHDLALVDRPGAAVVTTSGPWASMIYLARTDSGVIAVDLGWTGAARAIRRGLSQLDVSLSDVRYVFLTHAHRDHTYGWSLVRKATFVLGAAEVPYFTGGARYRGFFPRIGDRLVTYPHPRPGEVAIVGVRRDTAFTFGSDTVYAFAVPGHTTGSTAYLFRGILFGGDAINWRPIAGFRGARPEFSDNAAMSRASMTALWARLDPSRARVACSAHAKCAVVDSAFRRRTSR